MPEITDEEYECLYDAHYGENNPSELFKTIGSIVSRIESERSGQNEEIGPDALGIYAQGILDKTAHMAFLQLKRNISTFLKGRMEKWEAEIDAFPIYSQWLKNIITEIKHIHEALCGEVKDEQE